MPVLNFNWNPVIQADTFIKQYVAVLSMLTQMIFLFCLCDCSSGYTWTEADDLCKQTGMALPSIKTMQDVIGMKVPSNSDCGLITFLGLRRNKEVRLVAQMKIVTM